MRNYIVYKIKNKINDKIYIGCHVTNNIFDNYMGSGTNIKKAIDEFGIENFDKIVLHNFDNKDEMLEMESKIVNEEFIKRDDVYNIIRGGGFNTCDTVTVIDKNGIYLQVNINDPRYLSGELKANTKDTLLIKDENDNYFRVTINDPRYLSGELVPITKNMIVVKDENDSYLQVNINDPRYLSGYLKPIWEGRKHTIASKNKIGKANSIKQKGKNNSQFGTSWITMNGQNKKIKKELLNDYIKIGWVKGRNMGD